MRRSNRTLNRAVLALVAVVLLATATALVWPWADGILRGIPAAPPLRTPTAVELWIGFGIGAVLVVLALIWILTRGRGGTSTALVEDRTGLDVRVIRDLLAQGIERHPSVAGVDATAHRLRGRTAIAIRIRARRGSDLPALVGRVREAVDDLDAAVGRRLPLVVRITASGRERRAE